MEASKWIFEEPVPHDLFDAVADVEGWLALEEAAVLFRLARRVITGAVVEVGSYRGRSTVALAQGVAAGGHSVPVFAIEPHEPFTGVLGGQFGPADRTAFFQNMLTTGCCEYVRLVNLSSEIITCGWQLPVALLWIDGDHATEAVQRDWTCWAPHLLPEAYIVLDDALNLNLGPYKLIEELLDRGTHRLLGRCGKIAVLQASEGGSAHSGESRGSRTVLRGAGGETSPVYSPSCVGIPVEVSALLPPGGKQSG